MPRITQVENISSEAMLPATMQGGRLAVESVAGLAWHTQSGVPNGGTGQKEL